MKYYLIISLLFLISTLGFTQTCERSGSFTGGTVTGGTKLKIAKNGNLSIQMDGHFKTNEGPDLNIYLSNTSKVDQNSLLVHSLDALEASQKYKLNASIEIDTYKYVIIHCTKYNHHFGTATLNEMKGDACPVE